MNFWLKEDRPLGIFLIFGDKGECASHGDPLPFAVEGLVYFF